MLPSLRKAVKPEMPFLLTVINIFIPINMLGMHYFCEIMDQILIPLERAKKLNAIKEELERSLGCGIEINEGNTVVIKGEPYDEYDARNVIQAFGRGFGIEKAMKLKSEEYFSKYIDLKDLFKSEAQIRRVKARLIGTSGKTKEYVEEVSGAAISIYGNTVGLIGRIEEIEVAKAALQILIDGGMHRKAYRVMERLRRKMREEVELNG